MPHELENPGKKTRHETDEMAFTTDRMIVLSAGTKQLLTEVYGGQSLTIWAHKDNSGNIYVGNNSMTSRTCLILVPGASYSIDLTDGVPTWKYLKVYIDTSSSADSVRFSIVGGGK